MACKSHYLLFIVLATTLSWHGISGLQPMRRPHSKAFPNLFKSKLQSDIHDPQTPLDQYIRFSGGKKNTPANILKTQKKIPSLSKMAFEKVNEIYPATRAHFLLSVICTIVHMLGLPAPDLFALDQSRLLQLWRPFTSCAYLGPPSLSVANNLYFLVKYGQSLELEHGTATQIWFLFVQTMILTALGLLLKFPFQARSLISAAVYTSCNINPTQNMRFQFGLKIQSWQLPFLLMAIDCLSNQSLKAAWPHAMGIFGGHVFHFFRDIWPEITRGKKSYLKTPAWLMKTFKGPVSVSDSGEGLSSSGFKGYVKDYRPASSSTRLGKKTTNRFRSTIMKKKAPSISAAKAKNISRKVLTKKKSAKGTQLGSSAA